MLNVHYAQKLGNIDTFHLKQLLDIETFGDCVENKGYSYLESSLTSRQNERRNLSPLIKTGPTCTLSSQP